MSVHAAARSTVDAMLANMKRQANARHEAEVRQALRRSPSPPRSPATFYSNNRTVRQMLAGAPRPPPVPARPRLGLDASMQAMHAQLRARQLARQRSLDAKLRAIRAKAAQRRRW
jgi:hypothetical protein